MDVFLCMSTGSIDQRWNTYGDYRWPYLENMMFVTRDSHWGGLWLGKDTIRTKVKLIAGPNQIMSKRRLSLLRR